MTRTQGKASPIANTIRRLGILTGHRKARAEYAEKMATLGGPEELETLWREAKHRESAEYAAETLLLCWIDNQELGREALAKAKPGRGPRTVIAEDQQRTDRNEAESRGMTEIKLQAWKWRRMLASWIKSGWPMEKVAEENGVTTEEVEAAVDEFGEAKT